jgi:uncharacterized small protein (DUF1192 family)
MIINPYDLDQFKMPQKTVEERISILEREIEKLNDKLDAIKKCTA